MEASWCNYFGTEWLGQFDNINNEPNDNTNDYIFSDLIRGFLCSSWC